METDATNPVPSDPKKPVNAIETIEEVNDSPIEEVRLTVAITDDPTLPCLTFRAWVLGIISCAALAFLNQFFMYRENALSVSSVAAQILVLPVGKLMAATLPTEAVKIPGTKWSFTMNRGPFNLKEHCLITIFANAGVTGAYAVNIITIIKAFYYRKINLVAAMLLTHSTQLLGYGWAGIFRKFLVDSPYMWWPSNLVQVSLFRALHEVEIGGGIRGLGLGSMAFDWSTIAAFAGSPLAAPGFAIINLLVGFILIVYVMLPIAYWNNMYNAKRFPIISAHVFDATGATYNTSTILTGKTFEFDRAGYDSYYSKVNLSIFFVLIYGLNFAALASTVSHIVLFHGRTIWRQTKASFLEKFGDIHNRLMRKNNDPVPQWWFHSLLIMVVAISMLACEGFGRQLQLPYWGVALAMTLAFVFTIPVGVIAATTNQGLNVISEMIIGYLYPGKPLANVVFKTYGTISMSQAITFLSDFKLGHYMKIPPKSMFLVQLVGTVITSLSMDLPGGRRVLQRLHCSGLYQEMNYFFLLGLVAPVPVWYFARKYPEKRWIGCINIPIVLSGTLGMPVAKSVNCVSWLTVGILFNLVVYQRYKGWWARHNYILSEGLDVGVGFMGTLLCSIMASLGLAGGGCTSTITAPWPSVISK
ncbi:hypothetical protein SASPL_157837 [Salvia splendens]|uniref:Oligopeptide transporter n=1 Tax=Salvia splendens TaxID=180675 RepID=A0A8X8VU97_SALSN|nr:hypothetical protein SASPL_157837 [Salvia splendens]